MYPNAKPSEVIAYLGGINAVSQAAGSATSGWLSMADFLKVLVVLQTGVLGASATVDAKIQQASDSSGTGAKDITGKAIVQIVKASGDNKIALINLAGSDFDTNNGFGWFQLSITVGTATSIVGASILGTVARFADASAFNPAAVVQVVG